MSRAPDDIARGLADYESERAPDDNVCGAPGYTCEWCEALYCDPDVIAEIVTPPLRAPLATPLTRQTA